MTHEQYIEQQKNKLDDLHAEQEGICKQVEAIAKLPYSDLVTSIARAGMIIEHVAKIKMIEVQKHRIASTPFPKFPLEGGIGYVGGDSPEMIVLPGGKIMEIK